MSDGCGCNCGCGGGGRPENGKCPVCGQEAIGVTFKLVDNLIKPEHKARLSKEGRYFLCLDAACPTSYFEEQGKAIFRSDDVKVPLWYKNGVGKRVACYCNNITFEQVREQVGKGRKLWKEIVGAYRKRPICKCDMLNPTGNCCTDAFYNVVNNELTALGKEPVSQEFIKKSGCC